MRAIASLTPHSAETMDEQELQSRLSRIATSWDLVLRAHDECGDAATAARNRLMERYQGAAYRYLLAALGDPDASDDLFQEFALRFARGDFRNADPGRGRFRQFVKTALINLVRDYRRKGRRAVRSLEAMQLDPAASDEPHDVEDQRLAESWRADLLARAWTDLQGVEQRTGRLYYSALRLKSENPGLSSAELAARLTAQLQKESPWSDVALRKLVQRAREEFARLLVEEVARGLEEPTREELETELMALGLHTYCRPALERRRS
jgi:RNA polymerase sigma factor (sigma-70 family)